MARQLRCRGFVGSICELTLQSKFKNIFAKISSLMRVQDANFDRLSHFIRKRSINRALSAGGEFRDACVHVNNVDICDAEQLRGIERIGGWSQA